MQEVFIEGDSISMIQYGPSYRRCQNGYANLTMNDCVNLKNLTRTNFLWKFKTGVKWKKKNEREGKDQTRFRDQTNFNSYGLSWVLTQYSKWVPLFCAKLRVIGTKIWNQTSFILSGWKNSVREMSYENWVWVMSYKLWMMLNPNTSLNGWQ